MDQNELKKRIEALPDDKKALLISALETNTGVKAEALIRAAEEPSTAAKLQKLASKIDASAVQTLANDPAKLAALFASPQVKNALKGLDLGK